MWAFVHGQRCERPGGDGYQAADGWCCEPPGFEERERRTGKVDDDGKDDQRGARFYQGDEAGFLVSEDVGGELVQRGIPCREDGTAVGWQWVLAIGEAVSKGILHDGQDGLCRRECAVTARLLGYLVDVAYACHSPVPPCGQAGIAEIGRIERGVVRVLYQSFSEQSHVDSVESKVLGAWRDASEQGDEVCDKAHWLVLGVPFILHLNKPLNLHTVNPVIHTTPI